MKRILLASTAFLFLTFGISTAQAYISYDDVIAYTGFEEPEASTANYTTVGTVGEALPTQSGVTTSYAGGDELGFETYLISGEGPMGSNETTGDYIGVSDYYAINGNNSYEMEDVDDELQLVLETVDLTYYTDVNVSADMQVKLNSYSNYEDGDSISMYVLTDIGTYYLCDLVGEDILDAMVSEGYVTFSYDVDIDDEATWATFVVDVVSEGSGEGCKVDDIYFTGTSAVPVPGAVWLLGSSLLTVVGMRRKNS